MQPQYAYGPPMMPMYEKGGSVEQTYGLRNVAEQLRQQGRGGDTILAHINPQEARILKLMGGSGTINPRTGLPEYGIGQFTDWAGKELGNLGSSIDKRITQPILREADNAIESIAKALGPIGYLAASYFGGPIGAAVYSGFAAPGDEFNWKNAAKSAALTYAGQGISQAMNAPATFDASYGTDVASGADSFMTAADVAASGASAAPSVVDSVAGAGLPEALSYDGSGIGAPLNQYASAGTTATDAGLGSLPEAGPTSIGPTTSYAPNEPIPTVDVTGAAPTETYTNNIPTTNYETQIRTAPMTDAANTVPRSTLGGYGDLAAEMGTAAYNLAAEYPKTTAALAYGAYSKIQLDKQKEEAERILADQANKKAEDIAWAKSVLRDYDVNYKRLTEEEVRRERGMASGGVASFDDEVGVDDGLMQGGIAALAKGGLPPRYLQGAGDGMSDSIHARIGGKQEARLADGEFVIPADVVSHLGNGSSNAGAKKLYAMMDRVRSARTGKKRQAPEVKTERYMPA